MVFYEQQDFTDHLASQHAVSDPSEISTISEKQRVGRNLCQTFWCGFCKAVLPLQNEGRKGWDERFDHIGAHFHPEGRKIADWVPPIGNKTKGELLAEKQRESPNWDSESRSDVDAIGDTEPAESSFGFDAVTASPVDAATFPSPDTSFDSGAMAGIQFAGMGGGQPSQMTQLHLNTTMASLAGNMHLNGQLPSPAASGRNEICTRKQRFGTPDIKSYCCQCGDGPLPDQFGGGCACMTCGHSCEK